MTEIDHVLTFPVKRAIKSYDDRINVMENLINLDNRLKKEGYSHGIYNKKCIITTKDDDVPMAICRVTTYGDLDWLKNEIDKEPFVKKKPLIDEFDVNEEKLKEAKQFRKIYD